MLYKLWWLDESERGVKLGFLWALCLWASHIKPERSYSGWKCDHLPNIIIMYIICFSEGGFTRCRFIIRLRVMEQLNFMQRLCKCLLSTLIKKPILADIQLFVSNGKPCSQWIGLKKIIIKKWNLIKLLRFLLPGANTWQRSARSWGNSAHVSPESMKPSRTFNGLWRSVT